MPRLIPFLGVLLLGTGLLAACNPNRDTDQLSTDSPSTRNSTAATPDSTSLVADSSALLL